MWQLLKSCWRTESFSAGLGHTHTYALICTHKHGDVFHLFCSGRHIHLISLFLSRTGLSIYQPQSFLSKSIKLSCQINSAFLSLFPFGSAESLKSDRFVVPVSSLCCTFGVTGLLWQRSIPSFCLSLFLAPFFNFFEFPEEGENVF